MYGSIYGSTGRLRTLLSLSLLLLWLTPYILCPLVTDWYLRGRAWKTVESIAPGRIETKVGGKEIQKCESRSDRIAVCSAPAVEEGEAQAAQGTEA